MEALLVHGEGHLVATTLSLMRLRVSFLLIDCNFNQASTHQTWRDTQPSPGKWPQCQACVSRKHDASRLLYCLDMTSSKPPSETTPVPSPSSPPSFLCLLGKQKAQGFLVIAGCGFPRSFFLWSPGVTETFISSVSWSISSSHSSDLAGKDTCPRFPWGKFTVMYELAEHPFLMT